ncbi:hypothetical protein ACFQ60_40910 [Streptomyces zhihengii]
MAVWRSARDLTAFVARPDHRRIVRAHRDRGVTRSATWTETGPARPEEVLASALALLRGTRPGRAPAATAAPAPTSGSRTSWTT